MIEKSIRCSANRSAYSDSPSEASHSPTDGIALRVPSRPRGQRSWIKFISGRGRASQQNRPLMSEKDQKSAKAQIEQMFSDFGSQSRMSVCRGRDAFGFMVVLKIAR